MAALRGGTGDRRAPPWWGLRVERRQQASWWSQPLALALALAASCLVILLLFQLAGADSGRAFGSLIGGAFGTRRAALGTLVKATPLVLTALAFALAAKARLWNIGAEGQLFAGAMLAYWGAILLPAGSLPSVILLPLLAGFAFVGGALLAGFAGWLRGRYQVNEIITTVMLNYIVAYLLSFLLLDGPWSEPGSVYQQTPRVEAALWLPVVLEKSRLHLGVFLALAMAILVHLLIARTSLGLEIRALGAGPETARAKGVGIGKTIILTMVLSGGLAGLAGFTELFGVLHRLRPDMSLGYGFTGIIVAMLARNHPLGILLAGVLFGALVNGALRMQITTGVPTALIDMIQAVILLLFLIAIVLVQWRIVRMPARP